MSKIKAKISALALPIGIDASVSMDDLVSIKISKFEQDMLARKRELEREDAKQQKAQEAFLKEAHGRALGLAQNKYTKAALEAAQGLSVLVGRRLGFSITVQAFSETSDTRGLRDRDDYEDGSEDTRHSDAARGGVSLVACISIGDFKKESQTRAEYSTTIGFRADDTIKGPLDKAAHAVKQRHEIAVQLVDLHSKLSKIDMVARACRAEIAKEKLRADGHEALIERILSVATPGLALPEIAGKDAYGHG